MLKNRYEEGSKAWKIIGLYNLGKEKSEIASQVGCSLGYVSSIIWRTKNYGKYSARQIRYRLNHPDRYKAAHARWVEKNKEKVRELNREKAKRYRRRFAQRMQEDPMFKKVISLAHKLCRSKAGGRAEARQALGLDADYGKVTER